MSLRNLLSLAHGDDPDMGAARSISEPRRRDGKRTTAMRPTLRAHGESIMFATQYASIAPPGHTRSPARSSHSPTIRRVPRTKHRCVDRSALQLDVVRQLTEHLADRYVVERE